jgi:hypothetical protein
MQLRRIPIAGWQRCTHEAAAFESGGELNAAKLLDVSGKIEWWMRNDPPHIKIPTPAGNLEPDFVYRYAEPQTNGVRMGILEIKGETFWNGEGSVPRIKAAAACAWTSALMKAAIEEKWEFAVVLEQDALDANSLEGMLAVAEERGPSD